MKDFSVRQGVERLGEYTVKTVDASIILNANENNYPLPQQLQEILNQRLAVFPFNRYPPLKAELLADVIAEELDVDADCVKIGNGSSDLLAHACYVFGGHNKKIAVPYPSSPIYDEYIALSESELLRYHLKDNGFLDPEKVIEFCNKQQIDVLIICNPNNPTGNYNSLDVIEKIVSNTECIVLVDEAYMEFADGKDVPHYDMRALNKLWLVAGSALSLVGHYSNLIVFRTFSKAYGLAGLRCGYGVGSLVLMRQLGKVLLPYHVNAFSLVAAKIAYENKILYKEQIREIREERDKLIGYLKQLGFFVYPSSANFILVRAEDTLKEQLAAAYNREHKSAEDIEVASGLQLFEYLLAHGILTADFSKQAGLLGCVRISIGTPEENKQLSAKIAELCLEIQ